MERARLKSAIYQSLLTICENYIKATNDKHLIVSFSIFDGKEFYRDSFNLEADIKQKGGE